MRLHVVVNDQVSGFGQVQMCVYIILFLLNDTYKSYIILKTNTLVAINAYLIMLF